MPIPLFLAEFVPDRTGGAAPPGDLEDKAFFAKIPMTTGRVLKSRSNSALDDSCDTDSNERKVAPKEDMYQPLRDSLQRILLKCTVTITAHNSDQFSDSGKKWQPGLSVYDWKPESVHSLEENPTQLDKAQLLFGVETSDATVFGEDSSFILKTPEAEAARRRIVLALTEHMNCQWRNFVFFVLINDPFAYIIRADRTGLIVSKPIDFRTDPGPLLQFLWRYNFLSAEGRGMDPTVRLATNPENIELAKKKLSPHVSKKKQIRPVFIVEVPDTTKPREVLVWGSLSDAESLTGRCTRFAAAWDPEAGKVRFLKDMWRTDAKTMEGESEILRTLNKANVEHVPTLVAGEDVPGKYQQTVTQKYTNTTSDWVKSKPNALDMRTHHRLLENFIPTLLEDFKSPKQFLQVLFDGFLAHKGAYALGFLHRDVSDGNIMIDENGRGVLIDWELAIRVKDENGTPIESKARQHDRMGTWDFMSYNLLGPKSRQKAHALPDDQQSFLWIGLYYILLTFNPVILDNPGIEALISEYFEESHYNRNSDYFTGGDAKFLLIAGSGYLSDLTIPNNGPMERWYQGVLQVFRDEFLSTFNLNAATKYQSELDQHDALEQVFSEALNAEGWGLTRGGVKPEAALQPVRHSRHTGTGTSKRPASPNVDGNDGGEDQPSGGNSKRLKISQNEEIIRKQNEAS